MQPCKIHNRAPDTGLELTEVRTVLSRAENALWQIDRGHWRGNDPDQDEMKGVLKKAIDLLDRWRKCSAKCPGRVAQ